MNMKYVYMINIITSIWNTYEYMINMNTTYKYLKYVYMINIITIKCLKCVHMINMDTSI